MNTPHHAAGVYMRRFLWLIVTASLVIPVSAQNETAGPTNEKALKTYRQGLDFVRQHVPISALESFKKADKQDDGHCRDCHKRMIQLGIEVGDWKAAELAGQEIVDQAQGAREIAIAHFQLGAVLRAEGLEKHKPEFFSRAHEEMTKALASASNFPDAVFADGQILAQLKRDDEAKKQFQQFLTMRPEGDPNRQRALRFIEEPEMARARMAPAFAITATNGQRVSLDELRGKVVLIDFWATWCGPCREAMPHIRQITRKFEGQPLVVLSVSLDEDEQKWKEFVAKNEMNWPQYFDGGFKGPVANLFNIHEIPQTFTIDSDGILQDQHIGDASIEGKLKKLISRAPQPQEIGTAK
jgi:peroxiredoxin